MKIQKRKVGKYWHFSVLEGDVRKYVMHHPLWGWTTSQNMREAHCFSNRVQGYFITKGVVRRRTQNRKYYEDLASAEWL